MSKADGKFTLNIWHPGTYTISAENQSAGFPEAYFGFYGSFFGELPTITVDESSEVSPVEVRVGPRAGRVIFNIVDDESGEPVESGLVKVCRVGNPESCWSKSTSFPHGRYELLTPEAAFTVKFEVWGSGKEWEERSAVDEAGEPVETLQVDLGARKEVAVRLRRVPAGR